MSTKIGEGDHIGSHPTKRQVLGVKQAATPRNNDSKHQYKSSSPVNPEARPKRRRESRTSHKHQRTTAWLPAARKEHNHPESALLRHSIARHVRRCCSRHQLRTQGHKAYSPLEKQEPNCKPKTRRKEKKRHFKNLAQKGRIARGRKPRPMTFICLFYLFCLVTPVRTFASSFPSPGPSTEGIYNVE